MDIESRLVLSHLWCCGKCSDDKTFIRVRDVTLEEHGINKPYKGVYKCEDCGHETIEDNPHSID